MNNNLASCPYNLEHRFAKHKLFAHIGRCKDASKSKKKLMCCKKDSMIMFFRDKKDEHYSNCDYCSDRVKDETVAIKNKHITDKNNSISIDMNLTNPAEESSNVNLSLSSIQSISETKLY